MAHPPPPGWSGGPMTGHGAPPGLSAPLTAPPPPEYKPPPNPQVAKFEQKKKEWLRIQKNRFGEKRKGGFVEVSSRASNIVKDIQKANGSPQTQKSDMPPEHLRKIVKDIGDVSQKKFSADKRAYLGSLKYMVSKPVLSISEILSHFFDLNSKIVKP